MPITSIDTLFIYSSELATDFKLYALILYFWEKKISVTNLTVKNAMLLLETDYP